uniref:SAGA-associated factor 11 n=1 Tax=Phaeomonas parva TaxID=124430 RepID=A0A7S1TQR5_9STRA|mmetsp:Transcript_13507/g.40044  ORF Transcript_13507/g.40044 Transcript_13507/m.40044 type:complete len:208 (+) Transcript_13507:83-706(+)
MMEVEPAIEPAVEPMMVEAAPASAPVPAPAPAAKPEPEEDVLGRLVADAVHVLAYEAACEVHTEVGTSRLGVLKLYDCEALLAPPADANGVSKSSISCPGCGTRVAATKFATHYGRCQNGGGNGRRSRKAVNGSSRPSSPAVPRPSPPPPPVPTRLVLPLPARAGPIAIRPTGIKLRVKLAGGKPLSLVSVAAHHGLPTKPRTFDAK